MTKVVNRSGNVIGDDGKRLYGMDAELHLKLKAKEDPEWEKKVGAWVSEVTGEKIEEGKLFEALNDGQLLIKLVNIIKPDTIKNWNKIDSHSKKPNALAATGNIRLYLVAVQQLGVPGVDMFLVDDLRTGRAMSMVCRNLASLCRIAVRDHGWTGPSIGPRLATPGPKTWQDVEYNPYQHVDEISESELEEMLNMYKGMLEKERQDLTHALSREGHLKHEVDKLKKQIAVYKLEHDKFMDTLQQSNGSGQLPSAAVGQFASAVKEFGDPNLPDHLQPVEKSDADALEHRTLRRQRSILQQQEQQRKSSESVAEWQNKVNRVKKKMDMKRSRRLSFTDQVESPAGDIENTQEDEVYVDIDPLLENAEESGLRRRTSPSAQSPRGTPSKHRSSSQSSGQVSRKTLIVVMIVEAVAILGLAGAFAWSLWDRFN